MSHDSAHWAPAWSCTVQCGPVAQTDEMVFAPSRRGALPAASRRFHGVCTTTAQETKVFATTLAPILLPCVACTAPQLWRCSPCTAKSRVIVVSVRHILGSRPNHSWRPSTEPARRGAVSRVPAEETKVLRARGGACRTVPVALVGSGTPPPYSQTTS